jgi:hypothetical protein
MTVHGQNRSVILALAFAALTAALPLARAGDSRQDKVREAAAQSVKAGKVGDFKDRWQRDDVERKKPEL